LDRRNAKTQLGNRSLRKAKLGKIIRLSSIKKIEKKIKSGSKRRSN